MKKERGVSLISLIVVVIVVIILAGIAIYYGLTNNIDNASDTKAVYQAESLLDAVTNRELMHRINPNYYVYVGDNTFGTKTVNGMTYRSDEGWYFINTASQLSDLGVENAFAKEYLVNYNKGLAVSIDGIAYQGVKYYSLNDLKEVSGGGSTILASVEYDEMKRVNKPVLVSGMVPVKLSGTKWVVASEDDDDWYDYSADQKAWANVMLKDELVVQGYTNEEIRTASLSELVGKEVLTEGSSYVWIPRYTQTSDGSKVIFSVLLNDSIGNIGGDSYSLPSAFSYTTENNSIQLPGIWISKYEVSF